MTDWSLSTCNYHDWTEDMGAAIKTSIGGPRWWPAEKTALLTYCHDLAPRYSYFKAAADEFERQYLAQLERRGVPRFEEIFAELAEKTGQSSLVLLCHEKTTTAAGCHRRIFADWWRRHTETTIRKSVV